MALFPSGESTFSSKINRCSARERAALFPMSGDLRKRAVARRKKSTPASEPPKDTLAARMEAYYLEKIRIYMADHQAALEQLRAEIARLDDEAMAMQQAELDRLLEARNSKQRIKELELKLQFYRKQLEKRDSGE
ncbi:hypothetical protein PAPHI01_1437 [Pancytospora philotis]|nr:hypothetical protein PAPHI01_1437 [Pancytospora philotis]